MTTLGKVLLLAALAIAALAAAPRSGADAKPANAADTGARFVEAINTSDGPGLSALIDVGALGERVLRNLDLNPVDRARYLGTLRAQHALLGHSVIAQFASQRANARLVRSMPAPAGGKFLARVDMTDARGNLAHGYIEASLGPDGRIIDWYDYAAAMSMSGQLAFSAISMLTTSQLAQVLLGADDEATDAAKLMGRFTTAMNLGNAQEAHAALLAMPESVKARREFATLRVAMARSLGIEPYREALADLAQRHGDADDLQFILVDHYILTGQNELALRAVDRAARVIGDDEVMDANRCHVLLELGRKADALAACDRAIARDPAFETPRWTRVRVGLRTEDAPLALESMTAIENMPGGKRFDAKWVAGNEFYAWLIEQPEWPAWGTERGWTAPAAKR